jgi:hypothetical protein
MWPAVLPEVIGVKADARLAPDSVGLMVDTTPPWRALGQPRPLPGPTQSRNFQGSSFAAARISGLLAGQADKTGIRHPDTLREWLSRQAIAMTEQA